MSQSTLDPDHPYLAHRLVGPEIAEEITGLSPSQQKRARQDGLLKFYRHRGMAIRYKVADRGRVHPWRSQGHRRDPQDAR